MTSTNPPGSTRTGQIPGGSAHEGDRTRQAASDLGQQATAEGKARVEEMRQTAAHKADAVADSIEAAAEELSHDDIGDMSGYVNDLAAQLRNVSGTLREKSGDELLRDVSRLAREKPAVFLAGAVAVGFGLGRFARASQRPHRGEDQLPVPADQATADLHTPSGTAYSNASSPVSSPGYTPGDNASGIAGSTLGTGASQPGTDGIHSPASGTSGTRNPGGTTP